MSESPDILATPDESDGDVPDVADEESEVPETPEDPPADAGGESGDREPDVDEVELEDEDLGGDDIFAGLEDADEGSGKSSSKTADEGPELSSMATRVNEGAAKMATAGLEDAEKLQEDLEGAFELFQLGYFAEETAREYIMTGEDEIDPAWGLLGSSFCCLAIVLAFRPDGSEKVAGFRRAVRNIGRGA